MIMRSNSIKAAFFAFLRASAYALVAVAFFPASVFASGTTSALKLAFVASDSRNQASIAVFNGVRDISKTLSSRYGRRIECSFLDARKFPRSPAEMFAKLYADSYSAVIAMPSSSSEAADWGVQAAALYKKYALPVACVGFENDGNYLLCVSTDGVKTSSTVAREIARLVRNRKTCGEVYFRGAKSAAGADGNQSANAFALSSTLAAKYVASIRPAMSCAQMEAALSPLSAARVHAFKYYSDYARENRVDIARLDDYGEIFTSPELLDNLEPIRPDSDRVFALVLGALPSTEFYLSSAQVDACVYDDFYGWGYFAARDVISKIISNTPPSEVSRLLPPLVATPQTVSKFSADWAQWLR